MSDANPYRPTPDVLLEHPEWSRAATIYQVNTRQMTREGTLRAAEAHLPRIRDLGADVVWLMPVHEIGERNRKGALGSPYAVRDHHSVSRELGDLDDLKRFVATAHDLGLRVILDWVANHTAWDHPLVDEHPEWYARDWKGDLRPTPWWDWPDIVDLDYDQEPLRRYMTEAMARWVREADVDGFRCDVAAFVPTDFWDNVRRELDAIKPVFLLAESEARDLHRRAFDATYAWTWYDAVQAIASGQSDLEPLFVYYAFNEKSWPRDAMRMTFVSNHDKNAWEGTALEQFGDAVEAAVVLSVVGEGIPLLYCGQEAGNDKRLAFFDRDPIEWREHPMGDLYRTLFALKHRTTALWNGRWGARMIPVPNDAPAHVLSFVRRAEQDRVFAVLNLSGEPRAVTFREGLHHGRYRDAFSGEVVALDASSSLPLEPWGYRVLVG